MLKILVGGGDVQAAEEGEEVLDDGERHKEDAYLHGVVGPVGHERLGRDGHVGDGGEHGGEDADAGRPPGDAVAALKEVVGVAFLFHEVVAEPEHANQVEHEYGPVDPAKVGGVADFHGGDVGRADAGLLLAVDNNPRVVGDAWDNRCAGTGDALAGEVCGPSMGDGVIDEDGVAELVPLGGVGEIVGAWVLDGSLEDLSVDASEEENVGGSAGDGACSDKGEVGGLQLLPRLAPVGGVGAGGGVGNFPIGIVAAEEVELHADGAVLYDGTGLEGGQCIGCFGGHVNLRPCRGVFIVCQGIYVGVRLAVALSAQYVDVAVAIGCCHLVKTYGKGWQGLDGEFAVLEGKEADLVQGGLTVGRTAQAYHAISNTHAGSVGDGTGEGADFFPVRIGSFDVVSSVLVELEYPDIVVELFLPAFGRRGLGEVAASGHNDEVVASAGKGCGNALVPVHLKGGIEGEMTLVEMFLVVCRKQAQGQQTCQ